MEEKSPFQQLIEPIWYYTKLAVLLSLIGATGFGIISTPRAGEQPFPQPLPKSSPPRQTFEPNQPQPPDKYQASKRIIDSMFGGKDDSQTQQAGTANQAMQPANPTQPSEGLCGKITKEQIGHPNKFLVRKIDDEGIESIVVVTFLGNPDNFLAIPVLGKRFGCKQVSGILEKVE